jgi:hypothetical protein
MIVEISIILTILTRKSFAPKHANISKNSDGTKRNGLRKFTQQFIAVKKSFPKFSAHKKY